MGEHKLDRVNGAPAAKPDISRMFYLVDKITGEKRVIREMTDIELASYRAGVAAISGAKMNAAMTRLAQTIPNRLEAQLCLVQLDDAIQNLPLLSVIEYEQNRRANLAAPPPMDAT